MMSSTIASYGLAVAAHSPVTPSETMSTEKPSGDQALLDHVGQADLVLDQQDLHAALLSSGDPRMIRASAESNLSAEPLRLGSARVRHRDDHEDRVGADQYPEYINGAATFTARLAAGLATSGHTVDLLWPSADGC